MLLNICSLEDEGSVGELVNSWRLHERMQVSKVRSKIILRIETVDNGYTNKGDQRFHTASMSKIFFDPAGGIGCGVGVGAGGALELRPLVTPVLGDLPASLYLVWQHPFGSPLVHGLFGLNVKNRHDELLLQMEQHVSRSTACSPGAFKS